MKHLQTVKCNAYKIYLNKITLPTRLSHCERMFHFSFDFLNNMNLITSFGVTR